MKKIGSFLIASSLFVLSVFVTALATDAQLPSVEALCDSNGIVLFNDSLIEKAVRDELSILTGNITEKQMASLEGLTIQCHDLTDADLSILQLCNKLKRLSFYNLNAKNWNALSECTAIEQLEIRGNQNVRIDDLTFTEGMKKLSMVDLVSISEESLLKLINKHKKTLVTLALKDCNFSNEGISAIASLSIASLRLNNITCDTVTPLYGIKSIRNLGFLHMKIDTFDGIDSMQKIQRLSLEGIDALPDLTPLLKAKSLKAVVIKDCGDAQIPEGLNLTK